MSVPVPSTPTNPADLREQVARAIAAADYTQDIWDDLDGCQRGAYLVAADAAIAKTAPVLEGLRAERDEAVAELAKVREALQTPEGWAPRMHALRVRQERDKASDAAARLQQIADNAITALEKLRDEQLDRIAPVECDCAEHGVDCHAAAAQFAYMRAIRIVRPSVSDQTPARPKGAVRGRGNDPVTVTNNQLTNWAARIARLAWSAEDDTAHGKAIALAMEMKALTDAAPSSVQGDTTPKEA